MVAHLTAVRLEAPTGHGEALVTPHGTAARDMLRENRRCLGNAAVAVGGISFQQLLFIARTELLQSAQRYLGEYLRSEALPSAGVPVVLVGHQPELFHPGVWFKNFLLSTLAQRHQAVAVHLIIDQDVARHAGIRLPTGSIERPELQFVAWDSYRVQVPSEESRVQDQTAWLSFGERVQQTVGSLIPNPLIQRLWPSVCAAARRTVPAYAISQARHVMERSHGLRTWEVPLSHLCGGRAFHYFLCHILEHLPRFHDVFHRALNSYRRRYRIRSRTHPFPALRASRDELETPFWIWTSHDPRRRPLWLRPHGRNWQLFTREPRATMIQETISGTGLSARLEQMLALAGGGTKIRPRAVTTTMFARLLLCDLFVHGVGGAKYDRLTDELLAEFWAISPPGYVTATATMRLPWPQPSATADDLGCLQGELRDAWYHPEHHLDGMIEGQLRLAESLAYRKRQLISGPPPRGQRRGWHQEIEHINDRLRQMTAPIRARLRQLWEEAESARGANDILGSREYPYCIFPETELCPRLLDMARNFA